MATLIKPGQNPTTIVPENGNDFSLEELQKYVGGYIEVLNLRDGNIIVINEEGKWMFPSQVNNRATELATKAGVLLPHDYIVGPAVICKEEEVL